MINDQVVAITGALAAVSDGLQSHIWPIAGAKVVLGARHEEGQMVIRNRSLRRSSNQFKDQR
jgi:hypothetical protein